MSNHRLPPMTALSQCPEIEKENYTTTNVDSVATPLAGISPYSFHQSPNATMKTRGKDGSNCSTEAGTSEDDDDDEPSDRQTIMSVSSSPLHNVQSSPRSSNLSTLTGGTNTRVFGMRQEFASSTTYQRSPTTPSIAKQKASLPGKQQYHYVHFLQRCSPTDSSSNSGVCSTSKSVVRYRQHEVTPSSTSLKKSCTCHHRTCNVVNKTRKDHALVKMESRRSSLPKPFSPLSSSMSEGQTKLFSRSETLILFDWDDTLLPSSWLAGRQLTLDTSSAASEQEKAYLDAVSATVCSLLIAAVHCGRVVVVTNAESGWVDLSAAKFMPKVLDTLNFWHISIISARSEFESLELQHPVQWKIHAFRYLLLLAYPSNREDLRQLPCSSSDDKKSSSSELGTRLQEQQFSSLSSSNRQQPSWVGSSRPPGGSIRKNVVSFGDSDSERIALIQCVKSLYTIPNVPEHSLQGRRDLPSLSLYKSFKLYEHPTPTILQRQLQLVTKLLPQIVHHSSNLDLRFNFKISR